MNDQNRQEFLDAARRYLFEQESGNAGQIAAELRKVL